MNLAMSHDPLPERIDQQFGPREIAPFSGPMVRGDNRLLVKADVARFPEDLRIKGTDNAVAIGPGCDLSHFRIYVRGRGHRVSIGAKCELRGALFIGGTSHIVVRIGERSTFAHVEIFCAEHAGVEIGVDCMFSRAVEIRTSDAHAIYDATTRRRTNPAAPVSIGDHVWIGRGAVVSKGARVPSSCVVGANAFVNKRFDEENVVIAGAPAKIVKRNVLWDRGRAESLD